MRCPVCSYIMSRQSPVWRPQACLIFWQSTPTLMPRQSYTNFIQLVCHAEFIATDGCGNQQEFYYLGKPYLILRTAVEKDTEGLGWNAKVFNNDFEEIPRFVSEYHLYEKPRVVPTILPSTIIMDSIDCWFGASATHSKQQGAQP